MGYRHLSIDERERIAQYRAAGCTLVQVGLLLGRSPSTISRELKRNPSARYSPHRAQAAYRQRRRQARPPNRLDADPHLRGLLMRGLRAGWSPEQITGRLRREAKGQCPTPLGFKTIYRYLARDRAAGGALWQHLRQRGGHYRKRYGSFDRRGQIPQRRPLVERPPIAGRRGRLGDFESDTICTGRSASIVTHVCRKSRYLVAAVVPDGRAASINRATIRALGGLARSRCRTLTVDNGREFAGHRALEAALDVRVYFAPPYQSWQRGTNENTNGLLREYFPKASRRRPTTQALDRAVRLLNNRPRKCLNWQTPAEVFFQKKFN